MLDFYLIENVELSLLLRKLACTEHLSIRVFKAVLHHLLWLILACVIGIALLDVLFALLVVHEYLAILGGTAG